MKISVGEGRFCSGTCNAQPCRLIADGAGEQFPHCC